MCALPGSPDSKELQAITSLDGVAGDREGRVGPRGPLRFGLGALGPSGPPSLRSWAQAGPHSWGGYCLVLNRIVLLKAGVNGPYLQYRLTATSVLYLLKSEYSSGWRSESSTCRSILSY